MIVITSIWYEHVCKNSFNLQLHFATVTLQKLLLGTNQIYTNDYAVQPLARLLCYNDTIFRIHFLQQVKSTVLGLAEALT